jgi:hypothetical protein
VIAVLQAVNNLANRLNRRERLLAAGVLGLGLIMSVMFIYRSATDRLRELDDTIQHMHQDIVNYTHQIALKESVEEEYAKVASQHSSQWTGPEIHDRLRQELYRLAQKVPPELDEKGVPLKTTGEQGELVKIPALQQGALREGGEGFREYTINVKIPTGDLESLVNFLQRLQNSPQSLRIDALDINRSPMETKVAADMDITRIITAGSAEEPQPSGGAGAAETVSATLEPAEWSCEGGALALVLGEDPAETLVAESTAESMDLSLLRTLQAGATYDLNLDLASTAEGRLKVSMVDGSLFPEAEALRSDGKPYRFHLRFTVPGAGGTRVRMRTPQIVLEAKGAKVRISKLTIEKISG